MIFSVIQLLFKDQLSQFLMIYCLFRIVLILLHFLLTGQLVQLLFRLSQSRFSFIQVQAIRGYERVVGYYSYFDFHDLKFSLSFQESEESTNLLTQNFYSLACFCSQSQAYLKGYSLVREPSYCFAYCYRLSRIIEYQSSFAVFIKKGFSHKSLQLLAVFNLELIFCFLVRLRQFNSFFPWIEFCDKNRRRNNFINNQHPLFHFLFDQKVFSKNFLISKYFVAENRRYKSHRVEVIVFVFVKKKNNRIQSQDDCCLKQKMERKCQNNNYQKNAVSVLELSKKLQCVIEEPRNIKCDSNSESVNEYKDIKTQSKANDLILHHYRNKGIQYKDNKLINDIIQCTTKVIFTSQKVVKYS